jgi:hypothetical protein
MTTTLASIITEAIVRDICDRRGLGQEFESCDDDIQDEIRETWTQIIQNVLDSDTK